jgi:hypothetical protein
MLYITEYKKYRGSDLITNVHLRCKELPHQPEIIGVFSKEVYKM